jgi:protein SCO1/2
MLPLSKVVGSRTFSLVAVVSAAIASAAFIAAPAFAPAYETAPDFTLVAQDGRSFALSQQRGRPVVLFFGYAHCSDVCPMTLATLARTIRSGQLDDTVRVAFVTVDPRRDTPPVLKRFVRLFDPHFIGLTGSRRQLDSVFDAYHVWNREIPAARGSDGYEMAHSTAVYFIDRNGRLRGLGGPSDSPATLARHFQEFFS